ncbi:unnamed protein product, partial [Prorocentrum cordatum]
MCPSSLLFFLLLLLLLFGTSLPPPPLLPYPLDPSDPADPCRSPGGRLGGARRAWQVAPRRGMARAVAVGGAAVNWRLPADGPTTSGQTRGGGGGPARAAGRARRRRPRTTALGGAPRGTALAGRRNEPRTWCSPISCCGALLADARGAAAATRGCSPPLRESLRRGRRPPATAPPAPPAPARCRSRTFRSPPLALPSGAARSAPLAQGAP